jgi:GNAT superfamily N-acetyltransferase
VADFKDAAARFLFAYGPAKEDQDAPVIAVLHFRLTLAGELQNEMEGDPVLLVADIFVAPEAQRKGLGSHMLNLCQLIARGNGITGVQVAIYTALSRSAEPWLTKKQKGFELDVAWTPDADAGIVAYFKPALVVKSAAASPASPAASAACQSAASSPDSVLSVNAALPAAPPAAREEAAGVALASQFEKVSVQEEVPFWQRVAAPAAAAETVESASESEEEDDDEDEESEEDDDDQAERILDELAEMFEARHGRAPTEEEVEQWKATLREASAEAAKADESA